jgi:hypothetical protein
VSDKLAKLSLGGDTKTKLTTPVVAAIPATVHMQSQQGASVAGATKPRTHVAASATKKTLTAPPGSVARRSHIAAAATTTTTTAAPKPRVKRDDHSNTPQVRQAKDAKNLDASSKKLQHVHGQAPGSKKHSTTGRQVL